NIPTPETSTTASSGHIPTPDPTTSSETNYSGGSKAPAGEYRPADQHGPAQNVPRPTRPEGMNIESDEGLEKFLGYWVETVNYGVQTGDFTTTHPLVADSYESDLKFYAWVEEIYTRGGWIEGGHRTIVLGDSLLLSHGEGKYTWAGNMPVDNSRVHLEGEMTSYDNSESQQQGIYFDVSFVEGKWILNNVILVEGEL
ncbi:DUF6318 family protein, partial [Rothia nasisuis]